MGMKRNRRSAVFLDRDGTIAYYREYCCRPEEFRLLPGVGRAIRRLNEAGLAVVVVTNQSAIGRGWLTRQTLAQIHRKMRRALRRAVARVDAIYVCPHPPTEGCLCRKPGIGMLLQASRELGVSLRHSYTVGDRRLDVLTGRTAGTRTVLVRTGHRPEPLNGTAPDCEAATLQKAVTWILKQEASRLGGRGRPLDPSTRTTAFGRGLARDSAPSLGQRPRESRRGTPSESEGRAKRKIPRAPRPAECASRGGLPVGLHQRGRTL